MHTTLNAKNWTRPNSESGDTLALFPFQDSLEGGPGVRVNLIKINDLTSRDSTMDVVEPEFSQGPVGMGKALKLNPDNVLDLRFSKTQTPMALTVSFWVKMAEPGYLCSIQDPAGREEGTMYLSLKLKQDGTLNLSAGFGSARINDNMTCDLLNDTWQHLAIVIAPNEDTTIVKVTISVDDNVLGAYECEGLAPGMSMVTFGASSNEFYLERSGPGSTLEIDELLIENVALAKPHDPL